MKFPCHLITFKCAGIPALSSPSLTSSDSLLLERRSVDSLAPSSARLGQVCCHGQWNEVIPAVCPIYNFSFSCAPTWKEKDHLSYNMFLFVIGFFLPLFIIIVTSLSVIFSLRKVFNLLKFFIILKTVIFAEFKGNIFRVCQERSSKKRKTSTADGSHHGHCLLGVLGTVCCLVYPRSSRPRYVCTLVHDRISSTICKKLHHLESCDLHLHEQKFPDGIPLYPSPVDAVHKALHNSYLEPA